ncbi:MAG: MaoC family dehydratase [Solirubrobacteraceae bacterium]|jgi:acyl dehydratase
MTATSLRGVDELRHRTGSHLGYSAWHEITQDSVDRFADATDDHQWIHVDAERAKDGPFGQTIAQGYLVLSLATPLLAEILDFEATKLIVNYGLNRVRFPTPVPVGSRIRLGVFLKDVQDVPGGAQAVVDATFELEGAAKPACVAEILFREYV